MELSTNQPRNKQLTALLVQNNPKLLSKTANIKQSRKMIEDKKSWAGYDSKCIEQIDVIVFPEMSFTGYNFEHYEHILPMASFIDQGQQFQFARQIALKFNSYVVFGYVQKVKVENNDKKVEFQLYNSGAVLNRQGKLILNTRKSHLYFCDELWSNQGNGLKTFDLINRKGQTIKCAVGICMDINEKNFSSGKYELADFIIQNQCQCLLFISNWTDTSPTTNNHSELIRMLNYWLYRLSPLLQQTQPQRLFLISDRVGFEYNYYDKKQSWFFGCSGGLNLNPPQIYQVLDKRQEKCILIQGQISAQKD